MSGISFECSLESETVRVISCQEIDSKHRLVQRLSAEAEAAFAKSRGKVVDEGAGGANESMGSAVQAIAVAVAIATWPWPEQATF